MSNSKFKLEVGCLAHEMMYDDECTVTRIDGDKIWGFWWGSNNSEVWVHRDNVIVVKSREQVTSTATQNLSTTVNNKYTATVFNKNGVAIRYVSFDELPPLLICYWPVRVDADMGVSARFFMVDIATLRASMIDREVDLIYREVDSIMNIEDCSPQVLSSPVDDDIDLHADEIECD